MAPAGLTYATVEKVRKRGRVVESLTRVAFGTMAAVAGALKGSRVSRSINTSLVERQHLTDRHHHARKSRRTYRFSKDWHYHEAVTYLHPVQLQLLLAGEDIARVHQRRPMGETDAAMAAGLTDHVWSISEWISRPAALRS